MDHSDDNHDELVLGHEDLDGEERRRSEAMLEARPEVRQRLERLQSAESRARALEGLENLEPADLTDAEERAQERSLARLMSRVGHTASPRSMPAPRRRIVRAAPWLALAAAASIALFFLPSRAPDDVARLKSIEVLAQGNPVPTRGTSPVVGLTSGDGFSLAIELTEDATVAVLHLDPTGRGEILLPPRLFAAGTARVPGDGDEWVLTPPSGREHFAVVIGPPEGLDRALLESALERVGESVDGDPLDRLRGELERVVDEVQIVAIDHGF